MALRLVDDMSEDWAPEKYKDTYRHDLLARIREKIEEKPKRSHKTKRRAA